MLLLIVTVYQFLGSEKCCFQHQLTLEGSDEDGDVDDALKCKVPSTVEKADVSPKTTRKRKRKLIKPKV